MAAEATPPEAQPEQAVGSPAAKIYVETTDLSGSTKTEAVDQEVSRGCIVASVLWWLLSTPLKLKLNNTALVAYQCGLQSVLCHQLSRLKFYAGL